MLLLCNNTTLLQDLTSVTPSYILEVIKSVIGYFNLDPNRVLDIILESFESQPHHHKFFISLLEQYVPDSKTMCDLISFKFSFYLSSNNEDKEVTIGFLESSSKPFLQPQVTPKSLYLVTALLIQHGVMKLQDVYSLLAPDDAEISRMADKEIRDAKEFVRRLNIVSTAAKNEDEDKETDGKEKHENNQKFGLLEALIKVGDWSHAQKILNQLPTYFATAQPDVARELCGLVHILIDPVYQVSPALNTAGRGQSLHNSRATLNDFLKSPLVSPQRRGWRILLICFSASLGQFRPQSPDQVPAAPAA